MPGITTACFQTPHEGDGPGDEKIWFTTRVSTETLGRGFRVPVRAMPGALRDQVNESLRQVGYRAITDDWNDTARAVDPRLPATVTAPAAAPAAGGAGT